jgi:hypothetical protein
MAPVCRFRFREKKLVEAPGCGRNSPPSAAQVIRRPSREILEAPQFAGDHTARVTPVPIPNTEVKPRWADGTARETVWEIR